MFGRSRNPPPRNDSGRVVALLVSDLHLSHRAPAFRSDEQDWYAAQARPLAQLRALQEQHQCPVIIAGDIFDDGWRPHRCPAELINFALGELPERCYAVPGQHDLPYHSYEARDKSAYWTLVRARKIVNLAPGAPVPLEGLVMHGFPWGQEVKSWTGGSVKPFGLRVAVIHAYIWSPGSTYPDAPPEQHYKSWAPRLSGHDVAVFGDNHKPFEAWTKDWSGCRIYNCGGFQVRKSDERDHAPSVGLLYADGHVRRHPLDVSMNQYLEPEQLLERLERHKIDLEGFMRELEDLGATGLDFFEVLQQLLVSSKADDRVRRALADILGRDV